MNTTFRASLAAAVSAVVGLSLVLSPGYAAANSSLDQAVQSPGEFSGVQWSMWSAYYKALGQTLTVGVTGELDAVDLYLNRAEWTTYDLTIEIHQDTPNGALLATSAPVPAADIPVEPTGGWVRFNFPTPATVTAGDTVAIATPLIDFYWESSDPKWSWAWSLEDYPGGAAWGGTWCWPGPYPCYGGPWWDGSDLTFRTYVAGETTESANPQLSSFTADCYFRGLVEVEAVFFASGNDLAGGAGSAFRVIGSNEVFMVYTSGTDSQPDDLCSFTWTGGAQPQPPWDGGFEALVFVAPNRGLANDVPQRAFWMVPYEVVFQNTMDARSQPTDPVSCPYEAYDLPPSGHTVWYEYTPSDWGVWGVQASTVGSDYDTTLFVLDSDGGVVACDDDIVQAENVQSQVWFEGIPGQTYLIMIGSYGDSRGGLLKLSVSASW